MKKWLSWSLVGIFALWVAASMFRTPRNAAGYQLDQFGKLPVLLNGRVQPLDSVARNSLLMIRSKQTVRLSDKSAMPAIEWLLEVMTKPEMADERPVFRIDHPELLALLKLPDKEKHFSFNQLEPQLDELEKQAQQITRIDSQARNVFQKQVMKLYQGVMVYHRLKNSLQPEESRNFAADVEKYVQLIPSGVSAMKAREQGKEHDKNVLMDLAELVNSFNYVSKMAYPLIVPPVNPEVSRDAWSNAGTSLLGIASTMEIQPAVKFYAAMSTAFREGKPEAFNKAVRDYHTWLDEKFSAEKSKGRWEHFFYQAQPFYKSMLIYLVAFLLVCAFWMNFSPWLQITASRLVILALIIHTAGLLFRMFLERRPPVTNLYSSAIFIGWGAGLLGLFLEKLYKDGIGSMTASMVGFSSLVIAHNLALGGDTMEMLRAVLDTNFWLATHVVTVTLGYAATFVAGFLAILYILRGVFTRSLSPETAKSLSRMVYGIVCFATLFSFVGTILGGIWADQSWGRFWGWDPKENGALMIVLWNAAFLHARWGRLFPESGLMAMAVFGNVVTAFSWFGTNMLGIGLHSYGFMDQAFRWLIFFDLTQLLIIALAFVPQERWRSFQGSSATVAEPKESAPIST